MYKYRFRYPFSRILEYIGSFNVEMYASTNSSWNFHPKTSSEIWGRSSPKGALGLGSDHSRFQPTLSLLAPASLPGVSNPGNVEPRTRASTQEWETGDSVENGEGGVGRMGKGPGAEIKLGGKLRPNQLRLFFLRGTIRAAGGRCVLTAEMPGVSVCAAAPLSFL